MSRSLLLRIGLAALVPVGLTFRGAPSAGADHCPRQPVRVIVNSPPPEVVVVEEERKERRCFGLFDHEHKKHHHGPTREASAAMWVAVPAMVPAPPGYGCGQPTGAAPCQPPPPPPPPGGSHALGLGGGDSVAAATQDLALALERVRALKALREAEVAALDVTLARAARTGAAAVAAAPPALTPHPPAAPTPPAVGRTDIQNLNDKLDYLAALVDALAADLKKSDPSLQLPGYDSLNGLRKKP